MRPGTKKCILLLLAILMLCLLAWRLTPHTFEEITASDQNAITSLAGAATFLGVRDGRAYTESYALNAAMLATMGAGAAYKANFRLGGALSAAALWVVLAMPGVGASAVVYAPSSVREYA